MGTPLSSSNNGHRDLGRIVRCDQGLSLRGEFAVDSIGSVDNIKVTPVKSRRYLVNNQCVFAKRFFWPTVKNREFAVDSVIRGLSKLMAVPVLLKAMETTPDDDDYIEISAGSTVNQYYDYVSAWLSWAVRDQYLSRNPARTETATEPLPETSTEPDRQLWSPRERKAICATTDQFVDEALDNQPDERTRLRVYRNRALVYLLGHSGCRGAEVAAIREDPKRNGLRWKDGNLDDGVLTVYGKSREWEEAPLFDPAIEPTQRWRQVLNPPEQEWPVLPTFHLPSLSDLLPDRVEATPKAVCDDLRSYEITPQQ